MHQVVCVCVCAHVRVRECVYLFRRGNVVVHKWGSLKRTLPEVEKKTQKVVYRKAFQVGGVNLPPNDGDSGDTVLTRLESCVSSITLHLCLFLVEGDEFSIDGRQVSGLRGLRQAKGSERSGRLDGTDASRLCQQNRAIQLGCN